MGKSKQATCHLCEKPLSVEEAAEVWCAGCHAYICEDCDETEIDGFGHEPEAHSSEYGWVDEGNE